MDLSFLLGALLAVSAACEWWMRAAARRGARQAVETNRALFSGSHHFAPANPDDFSRLDLGFYDRMRETLEREGFRHLGDVEDLTVTQQSPSLRSFLRVATGDWGEVVASFYHVRVRGWMGVLQAIGLIPRKLKVLDLESELSDGSWVITSSSQGVDTSPLSPPIHLERLPLGTPPLEQLARHRERLGAALAARPGVQAKRLASMSEVLAAQDRMQQIRNQQMADPEALVRSVQDQPGMAGAKKLLIEELRNQSRS